MIAAKNIIQKTLLKWRLLRIIEITLVAIGLLVSVHRRSKFENDDKSKVNKGVVRVRL